MRSLLLVPLLLAASSPAAASICTTDMVGDLSCGGQDSGTLRAGYNLINGEYLIDPSSFSAYTCDTIQPPGPTVAQGGPDAIYRFICPSDGPVTVEVDNVDCEFDLFVLRPCGGQNCEFGSETPRPELGEVLTFDCVQGLTYWIVAEAYEVYYDALNGGCTIESAGLNTVFKTDYRVSVDCAERCDDGADNDGDGRVDCADLDCTGDASCCDVDGDGYDATGPTCLGTDCDDANPNRNPGLVDVPVDGVDQDCDGVDTCWRDLDGDGFGGTTPIDGPGLVCPNTNGYSRNDDDCRDSGPGAALIFPGANDTPGDGTDQDCDGVDLCYRDLDGDGFGSNNTTPGPDLSCAGEPGLAAVAGDCADTGPGAAQINPNGQEVCNTLDDDCDTRVDDADPDVTGQTTWYRDLDADGFGDPAQAVTTCVAPVGYVRVGTDCRDVGPGAATTYPGAPELVADGVDQDCDGRDACYVDLDRDGYGGAGVAVGDNLLCGDAPGESDRGDDCVDTGPGAADIHPDAPETCNGRDDDCDTLVDDADPGVTGAPTWYLDADGDAFGDAARAVAACLRPVGAVAVAGDCRDAGPGADQVYPGAPEVPADGQDQDCDGVDACYVDADGDGWGQAATAPGAGLACGTGPGEAGRPGDCLDVGPEAEQVFPGAPERCNGRDDDCDLAVDDADPDVVGAPTWFRDRDGDGFGGPDATTEACTRPPGHTAAPSDCDDARDDVFPGAPEICNGVDDDCDALVDADDALAAPLGVWVDGDGDGFGDPARPVAVPACTPPPGTADNADDCDDDDALVGPGGVEVPYDGLDQDCDGADLTDVDGDGFAGGGGPDCADVDDAVRPGAPETADGVDDDCDGLVDDGTPAFDDDGDGFTELGGDCDDTDPAVRPGAVETCDGVDEDCDGPVDEQTDCYDDDGDGLSEADGDCNDGDPAVRPGLVEPVAGGVDVDCDGALLVGDADGDGYTPAGGDCDDRDPDVRPGAPEVPDGLDQDCDGRVDEGTSLRDDDLDGFSEVQGDCDDSADTTSPGAAERPDNGVDDDCDGDVDEGGPRFDDDGDGFTEDGGDCDDDNAAVRPFADELANGVDDDCDDQVDEDVLDVDGDGFTVAQGDCDDASGWARPDLDELCDGVDNDCDDEVDEGCLGREDGEPDPTPEGCACAASAPAHGGWLAAGLLAAGLRRRRRAA